MSTLPPLPPHIAEIAGPLLIGHLLHFALFGVLSVQVYIYYLAFSLDPLKWKALVYMIYVVEFVQAILMSKMAFKEFAAGFGKFLALDDTSLLWFAVPVLSSIVAAVVQIFYAYRIKILSQSIYLPALVVLIALFQLGGGIALGVLGEQHPHLIFPKFLEKNTLLTPGIWNGGSALCDVIIAASMTYYLSRMKSEWKPTQRRVQQVMRLVIETGTLTATIAIINLAMYLIVPRYPTYYPTTSEVLGKMYSTTMMAVLNSRVVFSPNDFTPYELSSSVSLQEIRRRPVISTEHGGITMRHELQVRSGSEHWSDPLNGFKSPGVKELTTAIPDNLRVASDA